MSKKPEFKSISIKEEFAQSIEAFIDQHPELGYRSIAQFLEDASRRRLEDLKTHVAALPRFERINGDATGVLIYDRELKGNKAVHVTIKPSGICCDFHQRNDCDHVKFALSLVDVKEQIGKHKWKFDLPDE